MDLSLANVINISVATPQTGAGEYNTSNLAIFTREEPAASFGGDGYKIYLEPSEVGVDFGSDSDTYAMANAVFSPQPNILANRGYLVVIPMLDVPQVAVQTVAFDPLPASGTFILRHNGNNTSALAWNASVGAIQTALRLLPGLSGVVVTGNISAGLITVTFTGVSGATPDMTIVSNSLADADAEVVTPVVETTTLGSAAETLDAAVLRTQGMVQYFGLMAAELMAETAMLKAARAVQPLNKIAFFVSNAEADIEEDGMLDLLRQGSLTKSRGLFHGGEDQEALIFMASYAGFGLSTNFAGSNTTHTMHLKTLPGVLPDPSDNLQNVLNKAKAAGADMYVSIRGTPKVFSSGANDFFDNVYNTEAFVGALEVAGFNVLATTNTKVPQNEDGVSQLGAGYRRVCEQYVTNQFLSPGSWTSPTTFGDQEALLRNVQERGYYIYAPPVSQQLPTARVAREAPLFQIAAKFAGAQHSSAVIVNVNP